MKTFEIESSATDVRILIDRQDPIQKESCFPKHRVRMGFKYFDLM